MNKLSKAGLAGLVITAICCFTPILVPVVAALGLGAYLGYLDAVLIGLLAFFIFIFLAGMFRSKSPDSSE